MLKFWRNPEFVDGLLRSELPRRRAHITVALVSVLAVRADRAGMLEREAGRPGECAAERAHA